MIDGAILENKKLTQRFYTNTKKDVIFKILYNLLQKYILYLLP